MGKKVALLVTATLTTRVVVEVPDDWDEKKEGNVFLDDVFNDKILDAVTEEASENIFRRISNREIAENIEKVENDTEVPFGKGPDDDGCDLSVKEHDYRGQKIVESKNGKCTFYLYNEDGDIEEYSADSPDEAKSKIDAICNECDGFYNADGEFYQE